MGQTITAKSRPGSRPEVMIFDLDRSITGMGIERYASAEAAAGKRVVDVLARRLIEAGATGVTAYSNVVIAEAAPGAWSALEARALEVIEHLFHYYGDDAGWSPEARAMTPEELALEASRSPA